ncbi:hypothetical protein D4764_19G0006070 [Takifugu flavidus]|uniref:Uncharacterized protein n=1 Tax=Takifugu flavidus TaxID=433684 RepID=A0A5C6NQ93_9TELE|nr:hypothetical protein D4764_19G0006070 [Takifugu flavidus]
MSSSQQDAGDNRSIPGTDRVDELAEYLVELREQTGLTLNNQQVSTILGLWQSLDKFDKDRIVYAARHQDRLLTGRFRSPKKKAVLTPGVESTKRCVLGSSGSPAQWPNCCRLIETIFDYKKIRQLVLCNGTLMQQTTFQRVVNQTTLMQWYNQQLKGQEYQQQPPVTSCTHTICQQIQLDRQNRGDVCGQSHLCDFSLTLNVEVTMRRTAQEAHTPLKQWLVMAENDIATSSLKRFCKYILVRKSEPVSQTRHSTVNGKITT